MWIRGLAIMVIGIVIAVVVWTALGPTVINNTTEAMVKCGTFRTAAHNETDCALENVSATSKTMYGLIELLYPIALVITLISVGFAARKKF
jgi:predicted RND superfamily exporter protein